MVMPINEVKERVGIGAYNHKQ